MDAAVDICNHALVSLLGKTPITDLTEESPTAQAANRVYDPALKIVAAASDWTFLRERATLSQLATNPREEQWLYAYDLPSRSLVFRGIADPIDPKRRHHEYLIASGTIYSSLSDATGIYTTLVDKSPADFSQEFSLALAAKIAEMLVMPVTRKTGLLEPMRRLYAQELGLAIERDASQEFTRYATDYSLVSGTTEDRARKPHSHDGSTYWE